MIIAVDLDDLASQSPLFEALRNEAEKLGLSRVTAQRFKRKRGVTVRIVFRSPRYKAGDQQISYLLRENCPRRERG